VTIVAEGMREATVLHLIDVVEPVAGKVTTQGQSCVKVVHKVKEVTVKVNGLTMAEEAKEVQPEVYM
jgi:hypothetical protein